MTPSDLPTAVLRAEHQTILRVIAVLRRLVDRAEQGGSFEQQAFRRCVDFFRLFADACHHAKEEDLLFPVLEARGIPREGGPIGVMLYEHAMGRELTREMGAALDARERNEAGAADRFQHAARQYIDLLTQHIFKEDNILFNMSDRVMQEQDQQRLCSEFCNVQCGVFEGRSREALARLADELEQQWPA